MLNKFLEIVTTTPLHTLDLSFMRPWINLWGSSITLQSKMRKESHTICHYSAQYINHFPRIRRNYTRKSTLLLNLRIISSSLIKSITSMSNQLRRQKRKSLKKSMPKLWQLTQSMTQPLN